MFDPRYEAQAALLIRCLPEIGRQHCFALKGGTAINFFVRNLPRLSVDIDLTYLPLQPPPYSLGLGSRTILPGFEGKAASAERGRPSLLDLFVLGIPDQDGGEAGVEQKRVDGDLLEPIAENLFLPS